MADEDRAKPAAPPSWDVIASDPEFQKKPAEQRQSAKESYFNRVIAPHLPRREAPANYLQRNAQWSQPAPRGGFRTTLEPQQEAQFQAWARQGKVPVDDSPTADYDLRGFYQGLVKKDPKALAAVDPKSGSVRLPDYWKTPYNPSFGSGSKWATADAPAWNEQRQLVDKDGKVRFDERSGTDPGLLQRAHDQFMDHNPVHSTWGEYLTTGLPADLKGAAETSFGYAQAAKDWFFSSPGGNVQAALVDQYLRDPSKLSAETRAAIAPWVAEYKKRKAVTDSHVAVLGDLAAEQAQRAKLETGGQRFISGIAESVPDMTVAAAGQAAGIPAPVTLSMLQGVRSYGAGKAAGLSDEASEAQAGFGMAVNTLAFPAAEALGGRAGQAVADKVGAAASRVIGRKAAAATAGHAGNYVNQATTNAILGGVTGGAQEAYDEEHKKGEVDLGAVASKIGEGSVQGLASGLAFAGSGHAAAAAKRGLTATVNGMRGANAAPRAAATPPSGSVDQPPAQPVAPRPPPPGADHMAPSGPPPAAKSPPAEPPPSAPPQPPSPPAGQAPGSTGLEGPGAEPAPPQASPLDDAEHDAAARAANVHPDNLDAQNVRRLADLMQQDPAEAQRLLNEHPTDEARAAALHERARLQQPDAAGAGGPRGGAAPPQPAPGQPGKPGPARPAVPEPAAEERLGPRQPAGALPGPPANPAHADEPTGPTPRDPRPPAASAAHQDRPAEEPSPPAAPPIPGVDATHDVPLAGGKSTTVDPATGRKTTYIDRDVPRHVWVPEHEYQGQTTPGQWVDTHAEIHAHEEGEEPHLEHKDYEQAHNEDGNRATRDHLARLRIDPRVYSNVLRPHLEAIRAKAERGHATDIPPDLDRRPYDDGGDAHLLDGGNARGEAGGAADSLPPRRPGRDDGPPDLRHEPPPQAPTTDKPGTAKQLAASLSRVHGRPIAVEQVPPPTAAASALASAVRRMFGRKVVFVRSDDTGLRGVHLGDKVLFVNADMAWPHAQVIGHELVHSIEREDPDIYRRLVGALDGTINDARATAFKQHLTELYRRDGLAPPTGAKLHGELIADVVGDHFTDPTFIRELQKCLEPSVFRRLAAHILDFIDKALGKLGGSRSAMGRQAARVVDDLQDARRAVQDALRQAAAQEQGRPEAERAPASSHEGQPAGGTEAPIFSRSGPRPDDPVLMNGKQDLWSIPEEVEKGTGGRFPAAPVRLLNGEHRSEHRGYGVAHIQAQHGRQIRAAGMSVPEYVARVLKNATKIWDDGSGRLTIQSRQTPRGIAFVQLRRDGEFYSVVTVFDGTPKGKLLWSGRPSVASLPGEETPSVTSQPDLERSATTTPPSTGGSAENARGVVELNPASEGLADQSSHAKDTPRAPERQTPRAPGPNTLRLKKPPQADPRPKDEEPPAFSRGPGKPQDNRTPDADHLSHQDNGEPRPPDDEGARERPGGAGTPPPRRPGGDGEPPGPAPQSHASPRAPAPGARSFQGEQARPGRLLDSIDTVTRPKADGTGHEVRHAGSGRVITEGRDADEADARAQALARELGRQQMEREFGVVRLKKGSRQGDKQPALRITTSASAKQRSSSVTTGSVRVDDEARKAPINRSAVAQLGRKILGRIGAEIVQTPDGSNYQVVHSETGMVISEGASAQHAVSNAEKRAGKLGRRSLLADLRQQAGVGAPKTAYSTAFETRLDPTDYGRSRWIHFKRANDALHRALQNDPEFARIMEQLIPRVTNMVSKRSGRRTPRGWTWEHASTSTVTGKSKGVMRLVPRAQHTPGSPWWRALHPDKGAAGGYSEWAIPAGAPPN